MARIKIPDGSGGFVDFPVLKGDQGPQGEKGQTGEAGYTPIKGTDYFTPEEIENIKLEIETDLKLYIDEKIAELNTGTDESTGTEE